MKKFILWISSFLSIQKIDLKKKDKEISFDNLSRKLQRKILQDAYHARDQKKSPDQCKQAAQQLIQQDIINVQNHFGDRIASYDEIIAESEASHADLRDNFTAHVQAELSNTKGKHFSKVVNLEASLIEMNEEISKKTLELNLLTLNAHE